jgi:hypothetical protein
MHNEKALYGVIIHHRGEWWLASSDDVDAIDARPSAVYRLTDTLSPGLADWLREETGNNTLTGTVAELRPEETAWTGEFKVIPAQGDLGRHTLDAHPWGANATDTERRNASVAVDLALRPLPNAFTPVFDADPPPGPVLAIRLTSSTTCQFEVLTAKFDPHHRPLNPWLTLDNDAVTDSGNHVLGWKAASEWFDPVTSETRTSS